MKKFLTIVFSLVALGAFAFSITWGVINFNKVKESMSGTGLYTKEDLNNANEDGYNAGLQDKEEYIALITEYRDAIANLNDMISQLNFQVNDLSTSNKDYSNQLDSLAIQKAYLETQLKQLESSISFYESYIATLESDTQAVATFEYDGSVYAIQIMNKGSALSITDPADTNTKKFNGWKVDGVLIDKNTYLLTKNTKFVADITYYHSVNFMVEGVSYNGQFVAENETATCPPNPTKDGYQFLGWSQNGVDIIDDIETIPVVEDTTYSALFIKVYTVTFVVEGVVVKTEIVKDGEYATAPEVDAEYKTWSVDNTTQVVSTFAIHSDTTFVANKAIDEGNTGGFLPVPGGTDRFH